MPRDINTDRLEIVYTAKDAKMLETIRTARTEEGEPLRNRASVIRSLIREEHARLTRRHTQRTRNAAPSAKENDDR